MYSVFLPRYAYDSLVAQIHIQEVCFCIFRGLSSAPNKCYKTYRYTNGISHQHTFDFHSWLLVTSTAPGVIHEATTNILPHIPLRIMDYRIFFHWANMSRLPRADMMGSLRTMSPPCRKVFADNLNGMLIYKRSKIAVGSRSEIPMCTGELCI